MFKKKCPEKTVQLLTNLSQFGKSSQYYPRKADESDYWKQVQVLI